MKVGAKQKVDGAGAHGIGPDDFLKKSDFQNGVSQIHHKAEPYFDGGVWG